jgi:hypothetical protein
VLRESARQGLRCRKQRAAPDRARSRPHPLHGQPRPTWAPQRARGEVQRGGAHSGRHQCAACPQHPSQGAAPVAARAFLPGARDIRTVVSLHYVSHALAVAAAAAPHSAGRSARPDVQTAAARARRARLSAGLRAASNRPATQTAPSCLCAGRLRAARGCGARGERHGGVRELPKRRELPRRLFNVLSLPPHARAPAGG